MSNRFFGTVTENIELYKVLILGDPKNLCARKHSFAPNAPETIVKEGKDLF